MSIHHLPDADFVREFESGGIALRDWDHRGHVRFGWVALEAESTFERALDRVRSGLTAHLALAIQAGETPEFGYHETITHFWLRLVDRVRRAEPRHVDSTAFCAAHPELLDKTLLRRHFSKGLLLGEEPRRIYVEPDLAPMP